jgi:hypothetical protein
LFHWVGRSFLIAVDIDHAPDPARHISVWRLRGHPVRAKKLVIEVAEIGRPEHLAGALSHVAARAIRSDEGLDRLRGTPYRGGGAENDDAVEEELATLTTVPLGYGLLALGAAERHHTGGNVEGNWHSYEVATERHGGLAPPELAFLLAVQLVVRDYALKGAKHRARDLPANARKHLLDWFTALVPQRNVLIETLGLPDPATWRPGIHPMDPPEPFPIEDAAALELPERERRNWRRPVFRIVEHHGVRTAIGTGLGAMIASSLLRLPPLVLVVLTVIATVGGYLGGRRWRHDICSDPGCGKEVPADVARCPGCGGVVAGRILSARERLEAEEKLPASFWSENDLDPPEL